MEKAVERGLDWAGLWVGEGAEISPQAEVNSPAIIGRGCRVEAGARIGGGASVAAEVIVPAGTCLWNTVVWHGSRLAQGADLRDCVVTPATAVSRG